MLWLGLGMKVDVEAPSGPRNRSALPHNAMGGWAAGIRALPST